MAKDGYELASIIEKDGSLKDNKEKKLLYKSYAIMYETDLVENLELTSIELDERYGTSDPVSWRKFLNHAPVKKFIEGFLLEKAEKSAIKQLGAMGGKQSDALKIKAMVDSKKQGDDNSNILVVFLPQKDYV